MRFLLLLLVLSGPAAAFPHRVLERLQGRVVRCVDGDTFVLRTATGDVTVRLAGVDCPESHRNQKLRRDAAHLGMDPEQVHRQGLEAARFASARLRDRLCRVEVVKHDRNRRSIGWVYVEDRLWNQEVVRQGWAQLWLREGPTDYHAELQSALEAARREGRGLWRHGDGTALDPDGER